MENKSAALETAESFFRTWFCRREPDAAAAFLAEDVTFVGTASGEAAEGRASMLDYLRQDCAEEPGAFCFTIRDACLRDAGEGAAAALLCAALKNDRYCWRLRFSLVLRLEAEGWRICHIHASEGADKQREGEHYPGALVMEGMLRQRQELLNDAVAGGMMGGYIEPGFPFYFINRRMLDYLGYADEAEFVEDNEGLVSNCMHPDDRALVDREVSGQLAHQDEYAVEYRMRKKNGAYIWVHDVGRRITAEDGRPAVISVCLDVTARRRAQEDRDRLLNTIPAAVIRCAFLPGGPVLEANDGLFDMLGYSREEFAALGGAMYGVTHPDDREAASRAFTQQLLEGVDTVHVECRLLRRDGRAVWISMNAHIEDDPEQGRCLYGVLLDDTERVAERRRMQTRFEQELGYSMGLVAANLLAKALCNLTRDCYESYDGIGGAEAAAFYASATNDESMRRLAATAVDPRDGETILRTFGRHRLLEDFEQGVFTHEVRFRRRREDDEVIWCSLTGKTYRNPETDELVQFSYSFDVTEQELSERLLAQLTMIGFERLADVDIAHDRYRIINDWDRGAAPAAERMGIPPAGGFQAENRRLAEAMVPEAYRGEFLRRLSSDTICGELAERELYSFTVPMEVRGLLRYKKYTICHIDKVIGHVCVAMTDVTDVMQQEQRQREALHTALQAARQASAAKSDFLSHMSHEIRTPLNAIIGMTDIAAGSVEDPREVADCLGKIGASSRFLLALINDILDMSRIESGKLLLKNEPFSTEEFLRDVLAICRNQAEQKGVDFHCTVDGELDRVYIGDKLKLQQVLVNVLSNAVKFTPAGGRVTLNAAPAGREKNTAALRFTVRDTGIGMSSEFQEKLFEPFAQESAGATALYGGTGLGLAISKSIVDMMNGRIAVRSDRGAGSEFTVDVRLGVPAGADPRRERDLRSPAAAERGPAPGAPWSFAGRRVLVAEDHPLNTEIAVKLLERVGFRVDAAANGQLALELFGRSRPGAYDAVLMDIRMPVMDGLEAAARIRRLDRPDAAAVPIVAMTANAFDDDMEKSRAAGMDAHLAKPIEPETLYRTLYGLIGRGKDSGA